ncbi:unnamed protein product [Rotaria magnacalcarata]
MTSGWADRRSPAIPLVVLNVNVGIREKSPEKFTKQIFQTSQTYEIFYFVTLSTVTSLAKKKKNGRKKFGNNEKIFEHNQLPCIACFLLKYISVLSSFMTTSESI